MDLGAAPKRTTRRPYEEMSLRLSMEISAQFSEAQEISPQSTRSALATHRVSILRRQAEDLRQSMEI